MSGIQEEVNRGDIINCPHPILKSQNDVKSYRGFEMSNGLKVLIASDPRAGKGAASLSVAVGSMNDPPTVQGLAHLCEHLLFVEESCKGAEGGGYGKFISENGGSCNAFTSRDQTNYHFDVASHAFHEAFRRFASFFSRDSHFPEEALEREIQVVNLEHENKLVSEIWRKMAVDAATTLNGCGHEHSFSQFSTGNLESLIAIPKATGIDVLQELRHFHQQYYSSNIMSLVVTSRESLEAMQDMVVSLFGSVTNLGLIMPKWNSPFGPQQSGIWVDILSVTDVRDLHIGFPIPDTRPYYKIFPHGYLSHLIGHKGPGSMFSVLSRKGWVNNTFLQSAMPARGFGYFNIGLQLTAQGLQEVEKVVESVFQYISMVRKEGPQEYFWKELRSILKLQFTFVEPEPPIDFVQRVSNNMHVYPMQDVLRVGYLLDEYSPAVINTFLECLVPNKCRIMVVSKEFHEKDSPFVIEKWYGVKYRMWKISTNLIQKWSASRIDNEMKMPMRNIFIPSYISSAKPNNQKVPIKIWEQGPHKVWHYCDYELKTPKSFVRIELCSDLPSSDPLTYNLNQLMSTVVKQSLAEELYNAVAAGFNYSIKATLYGMEITVEGYNEKIGSVVEKILERVYLKDNFVQTSNAQFFQGRKEAYENGLQNTPNTQPYTQVPYHLSLLLREKRYSNEELICHMEGVSLEKVANFHELFICDAKNEGLIYGGISKEDAKHLCKTWSKVWKKCKPHTNFSRLLEIQLAPGCHWYFSQLLNGDTHTSSCCSFLVQIGTRHLLSNVLTELVDQILYAPCLAQLRSTEGLGYIVRTSVRKTCGTQGLLIIVQGNCRPVYVMRQIAQFLLSFEITLRNVTEEEFSKHKSALALRIKDVPNKLTIRANRLFNNEIYTGEYNFNRKDEELSCLNKTDKGHLENFYYTHFVDPSTRKIVSLHLVSPKPHEGCKCTHEEGGDDNTYKFNRISDLKEWKKQYS